jgi:ribosomal protein L40E
MWLMRELTGVEAVGALVVLLAFLAGIITTWGSSLSGLLLVLLGVLSGLIWCAGRTRDRRRLNRFFEEDVAASQRALAKDPSNAAAHMRLGQLYEGRGDLDLAIHHYEEASRLVTRDSEARLALGNAIERKRREALKCLICFSCGAENAVTAVHCRECGSMISARNQAIGWLTQSPFARLRPWALLAVLLLAVVGSLVRAVPAALTVVAYVLLFGLMLCYVYPRWARARQ